MIRESQKTTSNVRTIDFYYSAHSAFAYIGFKRMMEIMSAHNVQLLHRPIKLATVVYASGAQQFSQRSEIHNNYYFGREIERWAEFRSMDIISHTPTYHHENLDLVSGMLVAGGEQGVDMGRLAFAILESHWRYDSDLTDVDTLTKSVLEVGIDPKPLLDIALSPEIIKIYEKNTKDAISLGALGSPTFVLDGDMFYGQDRLDLLERALVKPFAPHNFDT
ncbi:MAG: DsbA family protein [Oceanospirillaceae bacterium]